MSDPSSPTEPLESWEIRRAEAGDATAIQSLYRELVTDSDVRVLPEQIAALAETTSSFLLVAEVDGAVRATLLLTLCPDVMYRFQPFAVVENIVVTRKMRGRGGDKRLLTHVEQLAIARNCTKLMFLSGSHRHDAHAFFRRCGFTSDTKAAFIKYRSQFGSGELR